MRNWKVLTAVFSMAFLALSCSGDKEGGEKAEEAETGKSAEEEVLSYSSEMINFGVYFDKEGKERTITLDQGQEEVIAYIILKFPEGMEVCAGQWKLELPEGVEVTKDYATKKVNISLGNIFDNGIAERYSDPLTGGMAVIHTVEMKVTGELEDARMRIMPGGPDHFLGITTCEKDYPKKKASSFIGVINPKD
ncbi:MAG: hypothetical protein R6U43_08335 [Candidatus Krumholzibacteriales bacterium]